MPLTGPSARRLLVLWLVVRCAPFAWAVEPPGPPPHRVFASSRFDMDAILGRPYGPEVPFGSTGARLWASSPQGWAFRDDVHWLYVTNLSAFDLALFDRFGPLDPGPATSYPSHVHMEGSSRTWRGGASFTFRTDSVMNPLRTPFRPEKRWTCWSSGRREDWYELDLGSPRTLIGLKLHFFDDAPQGGCRAPERYTVGTPSGVFLYPWEPVADASPAPERPAPGENIVRFAPRSARRFRIAFHHAGDRFYTGLYGIEPIFAPEDMGEAPPSALEISSDKFITEDDVLVAVVRVRNPTSETQSFEISPRLTGSLAVTGDPFTDQSASKGRPPTRLVSIDAKGVRSLHGFDTHWNFRLAAAADAPKPQTDPFRVALSISNFLSELSGFTTESLQPTHAFRLPPGSSLQVKAALAVDAPVVRASAIDRVIVPSPLLSPIDDPREHRDPLPEQVRRSQSWYDANLAYFDCSDPWVRKMYYHRAYNLRKNMIDPRLGHLKYLTQSEGRWRSSWYSNVISYGAGHQVREARWLRDPTYWKGHLRTWAENPKANGVYPSHITPAGPQDRQYTDWITSTAWDGHLVHPDRAFLALVADRLAANVRGWQATCDPDGDGLLRVDSHWWTGMEWQPSFFAAGGFEVDPKEPSEPKTRVDLDRVDLTAYNFGNAAAVARIYRAIGQSEKAVEFETLAAKIAGAVGTKMWDPRERWVYSLRADNGAKVDVKEVIGVYPFYFGMFPSGLGFEDAWSAILDPEQFWTTWPVASTSKRCAAYSQTGWPAGGASGLTCRWNGPTWPHANSIVLSAMARTLRANRARATPLTREKLWELFLSFTKAQYRGGDLQQPWTGEYYDGETGRWLTGERDYNHSTWLDLLIPDLVGLVPRDDAILEVDPLLPPGALDYFVLDGQQYRGHDVTIVWDAPGGEDRLGDGREGLDLYLDGQRVASRPGLGPLRVDLGTGQAVAAP